MHHGTPVNDRAVSRRQLLISGFALGGSAAAYLTFGSQPADAQVTIDGFSVDGDEATLAQPPRAITLTVTGGYEVSGPGGIEQVRVVLQVLVNDKAHEPDEFVAFDNFNSGTYEVSGDLLAHPEITAGSVYPDSPGKTNTVPFTARVILLVVRNAEPVDETYAEDSDELVVNSEGYELAVGGSGTTEIKSA